MPADRRRVGACSVRSDLWDSVSLWPNPWVSMTAWQQKQVFEMRCSVVRARRSYIPLVVSLSNHEQTVLRVRCEITAGLS